MGFTAGARRFFEAAWMVITTQQTLIAHLAVANPSPVGVADLFCPVIKLPASVFCGTGTERFGVGASQAAPFSGAAAKGLLKRRSMLAPLLDEVFPSAQQPAWESFGERLVCCDRFSIFSDAYRTVTIESVEC